jgi:hypothetical protein
MQEDKYKHIKISPLYSTLNGHKNRKVEKGQGGKELERNCFQY